MKQEQRNANTIHTDDLPGGLIFHWTLDSKTLEIDWAEPTLKLVKQGADLWPTDYNIREVPHVDKWVYFVIQDLALINAFHPLHLHGHDFYVLAQGNGLYIPGVTKLNLVNPIRRDTAILPGNGYLVIGFETDNPG
jgi:hypothetical protein